MLSVIICTYNRDKYIYHVLESLAKGTLPPHEYEIVLIDNNCTDNTKQFIEEYKNKCGACKYYNKETEKLGRCSLKKCRVLRNGYGKKKCYKPKEEQ